MMLRIVLDLDGTSIAFDHFRGDDHFGAPIPGLYNFLQISQILRAQRLLYSTRPRAKVLQYLKLCVVPRARRPWRWARLNMYFEDVNRIPKGWSPETLPAGIPKPFYDIAFDDRTMNSEINLSDSFPRSFTPISWARATLYLIERSKFLYELNFNYLGYILDELEDLSKIVNEFRKDGLQRKSLQRIIKGKSLEIGYKEPHIIESIGWEARVTALVTQMKIDRLRREISRYLKKEGIR